MGSAARVNAVRLAAPFALVLVSLASASGAAELVEVVKEVEKSVVQVDTNRGLGSGVIVDNRGWVLTNYHVIDGARKATVTLRSGKVFEVRGFLAIDPLRDLALLKTDEFPEPCAIKLAPKLPDVGEKVAAFGNPKGFSFTTSEGIVSAKRSGTEVMTIIGRTAYALLGYAADAMWIQTTAPISPGNSGGPLVNMNAELVGLNTWSHTQGQNLNFAISLEDIKRLLGRDLSAGPQDFATLPNLGGKPVRPEDAKPFELALPTGRVFSFDIFMIEGEDLQRWVALDKDAGSVVWQHPNGAVFAAAQQRGGVLNGETIAQYENREPMVYVNYLDGKRHGILKTWDEAGKPRLFAQYAAGRRLGFTCFFDDDDLALIAQYKNDELEYLQLMDGTRPLQGFKSESEALRHPKPKALLAQLDKFEQALKKNEVEFRKRVRDFEMERRRELASQLSPMKRQRIAERSKQRAAQNAALHQELYRRAVGAR
jgi:S1-C subfamily serine protease